MLMWLLPIGLWMFGGRIFQRIQPYLPNVSPTQATFLGHCMALQGAVVYAVPLEFVGLGVAKRLGYLACMWATVGTSVWTLKSNFGAPRIPEGSMSFSALRSMGIDKFMDPVKPWMQQVLTSMDFHFLTFGVIFLNAYPTIIAVGILGRRSLWFVASQCAKPESPYANSFLWLRFKPLWERMKARDKEVVVYAALAEILLAFWLTANLFLPSRQIATCMMYWYFLTLRCQVPRSREYHLQAWQRLDASAAPLFKAVPILRKPVDMAKVYFTPQYVQR